MPSKVGLSTTGAVGAERFCQRRRRRHFQTAAPRARVTSPTTPAATYSTGVDPPPSLASALSERALSGGVVDAVGDAVGAKVSAAPVIKPSFGGGPVCGRFVGGTVGWWVVGGGTAGRTVGGVVVGGYGFEGLVGALVGVLVGVLVGGTVSWVDEVDGAAPQ